MRRTRETMERIRAAMGLPPDGYRTDPRLVEMHFGDWQGFTFAELEAAPARHRTAARQDDKWNFVPPGAGRRELRRCCSSASGPGCEALTQPTVCVTHGGIIRTLFRMIEDMPENEAATLEIVQDRVLRLENSRLEWL